MYSILTGTILFYTYHLEYILGCTCVCAKLVRLSQSCQLRNWIIHIMRTRTIRVIRVAEMRYA